MTVDGHRITLPVRITPMAEGLAFQIDLPPAGDSGVFAAIKRKLHRPSVRLLEPSGDPLMEILRSQTAQGAFDGTSCAAVALMVDVRTELEVLAAGGASLGCLELAESACRGGVIVIRVVLVEAEQRHLDFGDDAEGV